jgi:2'-5' RNA ligase
MIQMEASYRQGERIMEIQQNHDTYFVMAFSDDLTSRLHVTFLAQANSSDPDMPDRIQALVEAAVSDVSSFVLESSGYTTFGLNNEKYVQTFYHSAEAQQLHDLLCKFAETQQMTLGQPQYAGPNFAPHMTIHSATEGVQSFPVASLLVSRHVGGYGSGGPIQNYPVIPFKA